MELTKLKIFNKIKKDELILWKFGFVVALLISVVNYQSINNIKNNERIIVNTLNQSSQFWVSSIDASDKYLASIGFYITQLYENYTPSNVENNLARLLEIANPQSIEKLKNKFKNRIAKAQKYSRNSFTFAINKTEINRKTSQIIITGNQTRWSINGKKQPEKMQVIIDYSIDNAMFSIIDIKEK
jgi:type IV conjugative transfer system protein TraE